MSYARCAALAWLAATTACGNDPNQQGFLRAPNVGDVSHAQFEAGRFDAAQAAACGPGGATAQARLDRHPYVQKVRPDGFEVLWTSNVTEPFEVEVWTGDQPARVVAAEVTHDDGGESRQLSATVADLSPDSIWCYRVTSGRVPWTEPAGVRLATSAPRPIRFVAFGDVGSHTADQLAVADAVRGVDFEFALLTGDVGYDSGRLEEYERNYFDVYRDLIDTVPFFVASGNHDYGTDDAAPFRRVFSVFENGGPGGIERWYSFDWGTAHFTVVDTERLDPVQARWIDEDLSNTTATWKIVVAHRPPFASGTHGSDKAVRDAFVPIFERHGVDLVLLGHEHHYERTKPIEGVTYVVTGAGGRGTRPVGHSDFTAFAQRVAHFVWVEADDATLRLVAIDATGRAFDSLRLHPK